MTAKPLPWNWADADEAGKACRDCYGMLELSTGGGRRDVWVEFDAATMALEWHDSGAKRTVTVSAYGVGGGDGHSVHSLKISDIKAARALARMHGKMLPLPHETGEARVRGLKASLKK